MSSGKKALVIHSPNSGRSAQFTEALDHLRSYGIHIVDSLPINKLDNVIAQGPTWQKQGIDMVIAAGGDGLVGGVTAHLACCDLPMGILPLGTANDVARTVEIPIDIPKAVEVIATGKKHAIDLGIAYPTHGSQELPQSNPITASLADKTTKPMYFTHAMTVGINVQFARIATDPQFRRQYGSWTYPFAVLEALRNYQPIEMEIQIDGLVLRDTPDAQPKVLEERVSVSCRCAQTTVVNAPIFWGVLQATVPGVSLTDRFLDVVIIEHADIDDLIFKTLRFFSRRDHSRAQHSEWHANYPTLVAAELTDIPGIHHIQARSVTITTPNQPQNATLDGEVRGQTPMSAHVADERLTLIVPQSYQDK